MLSVFLCSNLISSAYFAHNDFSNDNYIQIGKIKKETEDGITGSIFKYAVSEKLKLSSEEWFNRAAFTSLGKLIYLRHHYLSLKIRKVSFFDKVGLSSHYIMALYTKDLEKNGTVFNIKNLTMEISTDNGMFFYTYRDFDGLVKTFDYSKDFKTIKETKSPRVSCALIDLSKVLQQHITSQNICININTHQGNIKLKLRDNKHTLF